MKSIALKSPAKLNLYLKVVKKRSDGFHELKTIFERIDLHDDICITANATGKISISCDHPHVPIGPKNLVHKVASLLKNDFALAGGVHIAIKKRIPVAAGLAGGSSNAATVLQGLNRLWKLKLTQVQLVQYARKVGSDVAFFLYGCRWALGTGRGDVIRPLKIPVKLWHVLVVPRVKMLTPKVYGALNLKLTNNIDDVSILTRYLAKNDVQQVGARLLNDLEQPIVHLKPDLLKLKLKLQSFNPAGVAFSGSGPSIFSVVKSKKEAEKMSVVLKRKFAQVFVVGSF